MTTLRVVRAETPHRHSDCPCVCHVDPARHTEEPCRRCEWRHDDIDVEQGAEAFDDKDACGLVLGASDVYQIVTEKVIALLDAGIVPWRKPWKVDASGRSLLPMNAVSKRPYRGINAILLGHSSYLDPRWVTYKQASDLGGFVRRGEKSTLVVFVKRDEAPRSSDDDADDDDAAPEAPRIRILLRYYLVFNVEQCEGLRLPPLSGLNGPKRSFDPIAEAEAIWQAMPNRPAVDYSGGDNAFYRPGSDTISLPRREDFEGSHEFYSTLFHELTHATGHVSRLNRDKGDYGGNIHDRGREELIAEFGSAFVAASAGITQTIENSAAYINSWKNTIRADAHLVVSAAAQGQRAADYILGVGVREAVAAQEVPVTLRITRGAGTLQQVDLAQEGRTAWASLHNWAASFQERVHGSGCDCGTHAVRGAQAWHDAVNVSLGKSAKNPANLRAFADFVSKAADVAEGKSSVEAANLGGLFGMLVQGAATATGAGLAAAFLNRVFAAPASASPAPSAPAPAPASSVVAPARVEGDQANIEASELLNEINAILADPARQGEVDPVGLRIVRQGR